MPKSRTEEQLAKHREYNRIYRQRHHEKVRERQRAYKLRNRERLIEERLAWKEANKDRNMEVDRAWRAKNREVLLEKRRVWQAENRERIRKYDREVYAKKASRRSLEAKPAETYAEVMTALSDRLPAEVRGAVVSDVMFAILEGKLLLKDVRTRIGEFTRAHYRELDPYRTLSLDAPVPGCDGLTFVDLLAQPDEDDDDGEDWS